MWLVEFSLAHRIPVACFPCHKINKISISWLNYNRKQEILLKNLLQNQQNLKAGGIYSCTGIYFFKSALIHFSYLNGNLLFNLTVFPSKHQLSTSTLCISPKSILSPFPPILIQETPQFYPCDSCILYIFSKFCLIQQNSPHFMYHILLNKTQYTKETTHE